MDIIIEKNDILIEALEVFINQILYVRGVYPIQIFRKRKIYNTYIYVSIYPPLNDYILNILRSAKSLNDNKDLRKVEIIIYTDSHIIENYNFEIDSSNSILYENTSNNDEYLIQFEEDVKSSLSTFSSRIKTLGVIPEDSKFKINLHTSQSGFVKISNKSDLQAFPWLQDTENNVIDKAKLSILPLTYVNSVGIQIFVEQH